MSKQITIKLGESLYKELEKRAKNELCDIEELAENIMRRSMLSYKKKDYAIEQKIDDKLVGLFSRSRKGRKKK